MRVKAKITVKNTVCCRRRLLHTVFLTVILALTLKSGAALNTHIVHGPSLGSGPGKLEAYFFPPLHVPPYNLELRDVKTRLALKETVTQEDVLRALGRFAVDDRCVRGLGPRQSRTLACTKKNLR